MSHELDEAPTHVAVRWCPRCRKRRPLEPEWGSISGVLICSECSESTSPRERYNFALPDPVVEDGDDHQPAPQHVRREHVDEIKPRPARVRTFGRGMGLDVVELPPWLDDELRPYVPCRR